MSNLEQAQKIIDIMRHHGERMKHCNKYKRDDTYHVILGLAFTSEVGEIFDKIIKASRDDWDRDRFKEGMKKEVGDAFWYLCQALLDHDEASGIHIVDSIGNFDAWMTFETTESYRINKAVKPLHAATTLHASLADSMSGVIQFVCEDYFGIYWPITPQHSIVDRIQSILDENYEKIISRYERGVISGSGDNR